VTEARSLADQAQRASLYQQAQKQIAETGPVLFLYNNFKFDAMASALVGDSRNLALT
jgi:ABC-type transport system substrate-binding protein